VDWLPIQNGFANKTVQLCGLFLFYYYYYYYLLIYFFNAYPKTLNLASFFLWAHTYMVAPFVQTKMGVNQPI
jgi:hypothetical protein